MAKDSTWRIVDDLYDLPIDAAELDAVEAFLMPLVNSILRGEPIEACRAPQPAPDPKGPQRNAEMRPRR